MDELLKKSLPTPRGLVPRVVEALATLGGIASSKQIDALVQENLDLEPNVLHVLHDSSGSRRTELEYRLAWARTYATKSGQIEKTNDRQWRLLTR